MLFYKTKSGYLVLIHSSIHCIPTLRSDTALPAVCIWHLKLNATVYRQFAYVVTHN